MLAITINNLVWGLHIF